MNASSASTPTAYAQVQSQFAAHIRDPERHPLPAGIEDRRMAIYRDLFYRNIEGFIRGAFPVLHTIIDSDQWHEMIRDFIARHRCQTPYFLEISQEFLQYLQQTRVPAPEDPPFLLELAHYEWVELALDVSPAQPDWQAIDPNGDLLQGCPVISPVAWSLAYRYPVHRIGREYQPTDAPAQPTYLLVYRNRDEVVRFMAINAVTARLLALVGDDEQLTGERALLQLAAEMQHPQPEQLVGFGTEILSQLRQRGVVIGVRR